MILYRNSTFQCFLFSVGQITILEGLYQGGLYFPHSHSPIGLMSAINPEEHGMWLSILQWSLRQVDGTSPSTAKPLSDEDKVFLKKAFNEMAKDEPKRIAEIVKKFQLIISSQSVGAISSILLMIPVIASEHRLSISFI